MPLLPFHTLGADNAPAIVFLHGFLGSKSDWESTIHRLSGEYCCSAMDLPGHGEAVGLSADTYSLAGTLDQIAATIRSMATPPVHLVGYSMGGRFALLLADMQPHLFKSLTLLSASPGLRTEAEQTARREQEEQLARRIETETTETFLRFWYSLPLFSPLGQKAALLRGIIEVRKKHNTAEWAKALRGTGVGNQPSLWPKLADLSLPVCLLTGDHDSKFKLIAAEMQNENRQFRTHQIADAGHAIHVERPEAVSEAIGTFVRAIEQRK